METFPATSIFLEKDCENGFTGAVAHAVQDKKESFARDYWNLEFAAVVFRSVVDDTGSEYLCDGDDSVEISCPFSRVSGQFTAFNSLSDIHALGYVGLKFCFINDEESDD